MYSIYRVVIDGQNVAVLAVFWGKPEYPEENPPHCWVRCEAEHDGVNETVQYGKERRVTVYRVPKLIQS